MHNMRKELIFLDEVFSTKYLMLEWLTEKLYDLDMISNKNLFYNSLVERERLSSTYIGEETAIPHAQSNTVKESFVVFLRLKHHVTWSGENKAKLIFLFGVNESPNGFNDHLKMLSAISKKLSSKHYLEKLKTLNDKEDIAMLLNN